jgi:hypothetical protein
MLMDGMIIAGRLQRPDHTAVTGAAVHAVFLGDPPANCGTALDLRRTPHGVVVDFCFATVGHNRRLAHGARPRTAHHLALGEVRREPDPARTRGDCGMEAPHGIGRSGTNT